MLEELASARSMVKERSPVSEAVKERCNHRGDRLTCQEPLRLSKQLVRNAGQRGTLEALWN